MSLPDFFILTRDDSRKLSARLSRTNDMVSKVSWRATANINGLKELTLITDLDLSPSAEQSLTLPPMHFRNGSYLKSLLQKAVRRKSSEVAVAAAAVFATIDPDDFVRRLPIITIEDVAASNSLVPMIWAMVAMTKGFSIKSVLPDLLGIVQELCEAPTLDREWEQRPIPFDKEVKQVVDSIERSSSGLQSWHKNLLWALRIRRPYGGMKSDMSMLDRAFLVLWERFRGSQDPAKTEAGFRTYQGTRILQPPELTARNFILGAIDFHVAPNIVNDLCHRFPQYSEEEMKSMIWTCSSGLNSRPLAKTWRDGKWGEPTQVQRDPEIMAKWKPIEPVFLEMARTLLSQRG